MIQFTVGGNDFTSALQEGSLVIRRYASLRSSFQARLYLEGAAPRTPLAGQEILVRDGTGILWGGILVEVEMECHSSRSATVSLRGQGYEQILQRYCLPGIEMSSVTPPEAAQNVLESYIPLEEGINTGPIVHGIDLQRDFFFHPGKASALFDFLAEEAGYLWWIDDEKYFHFEPTVPQPQNGLCIDLTGKASDRLQDLQTFRFRAATGGYKNHQFIYHPYDVIEGEAYRSEEILKMQNRYGSGFYGAAAASSVIDTQKDAELIAGQILNRMPGTDEIEFTTDRNSFRPGQIFPVTAPLCGIPTAKNFCVTEWKAVWFYDKFRYTVTAAECGSVPVSEASWEGILAAKQQTRGKNL